jgi:mono/diheme cytochrome c family protein
MSSPTRISILASALCLSAAFQAIAQAPAAAPRGGRPLPRSGLDAAMVERGQTIFVSQCGFCHGPSGKGGEGGPDLIRSVLVLDDEKGDKVGPVILNGRPDKGMPKFTMTPTQILEISTFLHQRIFDAAQRSTYQILNIVTGNPKQGEAYFNGAGKCSSCHSVTGDLKGIGAKYDPVTLQTRFLMPRGGRAPMGSSSTDSKPITVTVTLPSGQSLNGILDRIDDFNVALTTPDGEYHSFARNGDTPNVQVHDPLQAHLDMLTHYTDADIHNLTAYLVTLK